MGKMPILYIIMRTDMASMNSGKGMAQASHASNAFVNKANLNKKDISAWQNETNQGFGTVIVLDGGKIADIEKKMSILWCMDNILADLVVDPTYPLIDGNAIHYLNIVTCAYVYADDSCMDQVKYILSDLKLHP